MKRHLLLDSLLIGFAIFMGFKETYSQSMVPSPISPYGQGATARSDSTFATREPYGQPDIDLQTGQKKGAFLRLSLKGFFPFRDSLAMQLLYDSQQLKGLNMAGYSFPPTDLSEDRAKLLYVDLVSFIPDNSWFRISLGTHLVQSDSKADSAKTQQDIALQKLLNGGGNVFLNISRPIYYWRTNNYDGFLFSNLVLTGFADIEKLNQTVYNPGIGASISLDVDFRLWSWGTQRMDGNLVRFGLGGRALYYFANKKYNDENPIDESANNFWINTYSIYFGISFFDIVYQFNTSNSSIFEGKERSLRISFQPVKY